MRKNSLVIILICLSLSFAMLTGCITGANRVEIEVQDVVLDDAKPVNNDYMNSRSTFDCYNNIFIARTENAFYAKVFEIRSELSFSNSFISDHWYESIYRTDKDGTKKVYDANTDSITYFRASSMDFYDNKLLDDFDSHNASGDAEVYYLNEDKKEYETLTSCDLPCGEDINNFFVIGGKLYLFCSNGTVFEYSEGKLDKLPLDNSYNSSTSYICGIYDSGFYYVNSSYDVADGFKDLKGKTIYKYDVVRRKLTGTYDLGKINGTIENYSDIVITGDYIYIFDKAEIDYAKADRLCSIYRVNQKDMTVVKAAEFHNEFTLNAYDGCVYVGFSDTSSGLYKLTPESDKPIKLSDNEVVIILITDDKWIYYRTYNNEIMRVTHDGKQKETAIKVKTPN